MLFKYVSDGATPSPDGTAYNQAPHGWRELTEAEFAQSAFFRYRPESFEMRQLHVNDKHGNMHVLMAQLFWFSDNTGVAMSHDYWAGKVNYYAFGCDHKFNELSSNECRARKLYHGGRCYHVYECEKCKAINSVDSSD